ncbi:MAG: hypothetical protein IJX05_03925 [Clostridia bacterium]|nr:hypothetical protein [Clostridia bacterium]
MCVKGADGGIMLYEKRLLVLGGLQRGCLKIERRQDGVALVLTGSVKNDCVIAIRSGADFYCYGAFKLTSAQTFRLPADLNVDLLSVAVGDLTGDLIMSGSFRRPSPWRGNLEDDVRLALDRLGISRKSKDVGEYFFDIIPTDYDDSKVAEVNYYRSNLVADETPLDNFEAKPTEETASTILPDRQAEKNVRSLRESIEKEVREKEARKKEESEREAFREQRDKEAREKEAKRQEEKEKAERGNLTDDDYSPSRAPTELPPVSFYESVKDQLERLFSKNSRFERLERILPESKWIKIDYDESGKYYLVGVIGNPVRYLCYGVPGDYSPTPPSDLVGYCQWLALDENDPSGKGFWIMYQDGVTGKSVL